MLTAAVAHSGDCCVVKIDNESALLGFCEKLYSTVEFATTKCFICHFVHFLFNIHVADESVTQKQ